MTAPKENRINKINVPLSLEVIVPMAFQAFSMIEGVSNVMILR